MSKNKYTENSVVKSLSRKGSVSVNTVNKTIEIVRGTVDLGIKSWGKIDYLTNIHKYIMCFVGSVVKHGYRNAVTDNNDVVSAKEVKRNNKINMAAMSKTAMRKAKSK